MTAWKKTSENTPRHHICRMSPAKAFEKKSSSQSGSELNERSMLSRNPFGASFVIFTEFWRTATGKVLTGYEVIQSLKFACAVASSVSRGEFLHKKILFFDFRINSRESIQILSNSLIHDSMTWQFWSTTHCPRRTLSSINFSARGPCPWPSEIDLHLKSARGSSQLIILAN